MAAGDYIAYTFYTQDEIFLAFLSQHPFESFEETETGTTIAYISDEANISQVKYAVQDLCVQHLVTVEEKVIKPQNWNAQWEASFQPVEINNFCRIRADFHPAVEGYTHDLVVNPKMAFGTGHHETTWMMIDAMSKLDFLGKSVFDYGCGTGVLAILAEKLGSTQIDALDIEIESYENTIENASINNCQHITPLHGELEKVDNKTYDFILANINRHVLLQFADQLYISLEKGGTLLMSGILGQDVDLVSETYSEAGFSIEEVKKRGNWRCLKLGK